MAKTRSPGATVVTPAPTVLTTPDSSLPGEKGSGGFNWYLLWMIRTSGKLTPAACTVTTASAGPGVGDARSSTTNESGGPNALQTTAFTGASLLRVARLITRQRSARMCI